MLSVLVFLIASQSPPLPDLSPMAQSPFGDGVNVDVFDFIREDIKRANKRGSVKAAKALRTLAEAHRTSKVPVKNFESNVVEGQTSHVLTALCVATKGCLSAAVYDRFGVAVAMTSNGPLLRGLLTPVEQKTLVADTPVFVAADRKRAKPEILTEGLCLKNGEVEFCRAATFGFVRLAR